MIGSFFSRALIMVLGYAYPAYECYKTVELNKPDIEQLRFWCQYWIIVAFLAVFERVGDALVSWLPMYGEAKLAFYIYLWFPKTKGTTYVYETFFRPYIASNEAEIDHNLVMLRTRAVDMMVLGWQKAASYGQIRFFEILHYVASQSQAPRADPVQNHQPQQLHQAEMNKAPPPTSAAPEPESEQAQQPVSSVTAATQRATQQPQHQAPPAVSAPSQPSGSQQPQQATQVPPNPRKSQLQEQFTNSNRSSVPTSPARPQSSTSNPVSSGPHQSPPNDEAMQVDASSAAATSDTSNAGPKESVIEEAVRVTRGRLRRRADIARGAPSIR